MQPEELLAAGSFGMGVLGYVVGRFTHGLILRSKPKESQKFDDWYVRLEQHAVELCRAHLDVAVIQASLGELLAHMPEDFTPAVFKALGLGEALERAVLAEAERRGVLPAGFSVAPETGRSAPDAAVLPFPRLAVAGEEQGPALVWRGGKLQPR